MKPRPPMTTRRVFSLVKRGVRDEIHSRGSFVPRHEALTEIAQEIVVARLGVRLCHRAEATPHPRFHCKPWKFLDDGLHLTRRNELVLQPDDIEADAGGAQRDLGLLIEADRGRRIESDAVPDQLRPALVETDIYCKRPCEIRS